MLRKILFGLVIGFLIMARKYPFGRQRKNTKSKPPAGKKYSHGAHHFVDIDPNTGTTGVTPSPNHITTAAEPCDEHERMIATLEQCPIDSPIAKQTVENRTIENGTVENRTVENGTIDNGAEANVETEQMESETESMETETELVKRSSYVSHSFVEIDEDIYYHKDINDPSRPPTAKTGGKNAQAKAMKALKTVLNAAGTVAHQTTLLWKYFHNKEGRQAGVTLGILDDPNRHCSVASSMAHNFNETMQLNRGRNSNDARAFRDMVLLAVCPTAPPEGSDESITLHYEAQVRDMAAEFSFTPEQKEAAFLAGRKRAAMFDDPKGKFEWIQHPKRHAPRDKKITKKLIEDFHYYLVHQCELVTASLNKEDTILVSKPDGNKVKARKYFYTFSKRELYDECIKHPSQGGFAGFREAKDPDKVYISMSTFERMFPPNLKRMTTAQKEMCGCEICIDFKNPFNALTAFRNKWVKVYEEAYQAQHKLPSYKRQM